MKKNITIPYDEEKLNTLKVYLSQKGVSVENELEKALDTLYTKIVPAGVREFFELRSGTAPKPPAPKAKKKPLPSSAVGADGASDGENK